MAKKMQPANTWGFQDVSVLVEMGVPISRIAKQFGKSRQAVYDLLEKGRGVSTTDSPQNVNPATAQGYEVTPEAYRTTAHQGGAL
jgi:transposase-like protein